MWKRRPAGGITVAMSDDAMSHLLPEALPKQTGGAEHHEHDEDAEDHGLAPLLAQTHAVVEALDQADQQSTEDSAGQVPDATEHGRREGDEAEGEAEVVGGGSDDLLVHQAGRTG